MLSVLLYTANCGGYDGHHLGVPTQVYADDRVADVRYITEHPSVLGQAGDRLNGRRWKTHPHEAGDADVFIWVDACLEVTSPTFVRDVLGQLGDGDVAVFDHPDLDTVEQEVEASDVVGKYPGNRHREQVAAYRSTLRGRELGPLRALTVIASRDGEKSRALSHVIWSETLRWSMPKVFTCQDQLIFPWATEVLDVDVRVLEPPLRTVLRAGNLWHNDWFTRHPHRRET